MKKGEQMQVIVKDIDVVSNLIALFEHTLACSIAKHRENNHYRLVIRKRQ